MPNFQHVHHALKSPLPNSLDHLLKKQALQTPENIAITAPGRLSLTYQQLWHQVERVVSVLNKTGLGRQDRIAMVLPNGPEMAVAFLGVSAGHVSAPLNPANGAEEFEFCLSDLNAKALLIHLDMESPAREVARRRHIPIIELNPVPKEEAGIFRLNTEFSPTLSPVEFAQPDDVALVLHTSGTTSKPKLVPLTHKNLCASAHHIRTTLNLNEKDRCLNVMPLFHIHGLVGALLASLNAGGSVVCTPGFQAQNVLDWLEECRPTWYTAVPTIHQAVLTQVMEIPNHHTSWPLRFIRSSSAPLPPKLMTALETIFQVPVVEAYGMTEAAHQVASNPLPPQMRKAGSVGFAAGPDIVVMDESNHPLPPGMPGELAIRGVHVMRAYANNPSENKTAFANEWFRTGDLGYMDSEGYLFLTGRTKEIINRGGEKISPREVDDILLRHPAVSQAVTFPVPHQTLGEDIAAAVVLDQPTTVTEHELQEFVGARVADFKVPSQVFIVEALPKGPTGKLQRIGLWEHVCHEGRTTSKVRGSWPSTSLSLNAQDQKTLTTVSRTPTQSIIAAVWQQALGLERVDVHDTFVNLGGDSLLATKVSKQLEKQVGLRIEPKNLMFYTLGQIASVCEEQGFCLQGPVPHGFKQAIFHSTLKAYSVTRRALRK